MAYSRKSLGSVQLSWSKALVRLSLVAMTAALLASCSGGVSTGTAGNLDTSFGVGSDGTPDGFVSLSLGNGDDQTESVAVQSDGKVVVLGTSTSVEGSENMIVARLNTNGSLDTSFGVGSDGTPDGFVSLSLGDGDDSGQSVAVQADGKIVVLGTSTSVEGSENMIVARLNANGSLDTTFGVGSDGTPDGFVSLSLGDGDDSADALTLQADGKIVVAGTTTSVDAGSTNIVVARLTTSGGLDATFGAGNSDGTPDGFVNISLGDGDDEAQALGVQSNGKIVVVGNSNSVGDGSSNIALARLNADGSLDTSFGAGNSDGTPDGIVNLSLGDGDDESDTLAIQADGKILVGGTTTSYVASITSANIAVARLNANGSLDTTFGAGTSDGSIDGVVTLSLGDGEDSGQSVAVQADGKIVVLGTSTSLEGSENIIVARLNSNGSLDTSFGAGSTDDTPSGYVNLSLGDGDDAADGLALQTNGKIVVAGTSTSIEGSENMIVARLLGN
jgi:uncharacterized delta-60 repeat protein